MAACCTVLTPSVTRVCFAQTNAAADGRMRPIFDGKSLNGWVIEGQGGKGVWSVTDEGELHCQGTGYGFLRYEKRLCDFELTLEYRMGDDCNSGVGIRGEPYTNLGPSVTGYELQILADRGKTPTTRSSMSLYRLVAPRLNATRAVGQWNKLRVVCRGPRIQVILNGKTVHDFDQNQLAETKDKPQCGYLSLQNHGREIWYRNLQLRRLPTAKPPQTSEG